MGPSRARAPAFLSALLAFAVWAVARGDDSAAGSRCTYANGAVVVSAPSDESVSLRIGAGGEVLVEGARCGAATTDSTDAIEVTGRDAELEVDLRGGSFARVPVHVSLSGSDARVRVVGSARDEEFVATGSKVRLPAAEGDRVTLRGVRLLAVDGGAGADTIDARRYGGPLTLSGGRGPDSLAGGREADVLRGGWAADRLRGGRGRDRLLGGTGGDRCWGGPDRDRMSSCDTPFLFESGRIDRETRRRISGTSWHSGCPVGIGDLRLIELRFHGFDSDVHRGELIVNRDAVTAMRSAMRRIYRSHFPIRRMRLIDDYGADDHRSMDADNTSAFNCRYVAGKPGVWSQHAYGRAIDINTIENPYVTPSGYVSPPAGRPYADRSRHAEGMIHHGDATWRAFTNAGWGWAGDWPGTKDYQHFSANGE
jgi:hypothetical protein